MIRLRSPRPPSPQLQQNQQRQEGTKTPQFETCGKLSQEIKKRLLLWGELGKSPNLMENTQKAQPQQHPLTPKTCAGNNPAAKNVVPQIQQ